MDFLKDVLRSMKGETRALIDGLEGRESVELINAMNESNGPGKEFFLRFSRKESRPGVER